MQESVAMSSSVIPVDTILDGVGVVIGVFSILVIVRSLSKVGGQVGSAFTLTLIGVLFQAFALAYNLVVLDFHILPNLTFFGLLSGHNVHEILMVLGLIFFTLAARSFSNLSR